MIDCNITKNYFNEKLRMTKRTRKGLCKIDCSVCPLCSENNGTSGLVSCTTLEMLYPEKAIEIVQRWSNANPQRTYLSEFLKHYPNAQLNDAGLPTTGCPYRLGLIGDEECKKNRDCVKCWNHPMPIKDDEE